MSFAFQKLEQVKLGQALQSTIENRKTEIEALVSLAEKLETYAPGADAKKMKKDAENISEEWKTVLKECNRALKAAQLYIDTKNKYKKSVTAAENFLESCRITAGFNHSNQAIVDLMVNNDRLKAGLIFNAFSLDVLPILALTEFESGWKRCWINVQHAADDLLKLDAEEEFVKDTMDTLQDTANTLEQRLRQLLEERQKRDAHVDALLSRTSSLYNEIKNIASVSRVI
jgi:ElaB/YqjD/DUF883 family membrane-anchored ribosome-binding protein